MAQQHLDFVTPADNLPTAAAKIEDNFTELYVTYSDALIAAFVSLTTAANKGLHFTGSNVPATHDLTAFALTLLDDANGAAVLTTLGVTAAAQTVLDDTTVGAMLTTLGGLALAGGTMTGVLLLDDSTNVTTAPVLSFDGDANTGIGHSAADTLDFVTGGTDRLQITSGGVVSLLSGQLKFPASQNASADANTLDDYEEGTWTPIDGSGAALSFSVASGTYTKIGREVIVRGRVTWPATADGNNAIVGGFPFTSVNSDAAQGGCLAYSSESTAVRFMVDKNATTGKPYNSTGGNITNATLSGDSLWLNATYPTT